MNFINLDIVTLEKPLFQGEVLQLTAPTKLGEVTILPNHIPLITNLEAGELKLKIALREDKNQSDHVYIAIAKGFMEVKPHSVVNIIADSALRVEEIDEKRALEAKERAEQLLKEYQTGKQHLTDQEFAGASAQLARALAELKVVRRRKKK